DACDAPRRYTISVGGFHEGYSFTGPGNGIGAFFQDRAFHGWNVGMGTSYEHRFQLDDVDLSMNAAHTIPWHGAFAGFTLGGATRGVFLPKENGSLLGGLALGSGWIFQSDFSFRHYMPANVYGFAPALTFERWNSVFTGGYSINGTAYTDGSHGSW